MARTIDEPETLLTHQRTRKRSRRLARTGRTTRAEALPFPPRNIVAWQRSLRLRLTTATAVAAAAMLRLPDQLKPQCAYAA
jgi:hypothetical protein